MPRVTADEYGMIAIIRLDGEPVLLAEFSAKWRIDHAIVYLEREPRLSSDITDAVKQMSAHTLDPILAALEDYVAQGE